MDLTPQLIRDALQLVDLHGWDGADGRALLDLVRRAVVVPTVRRSGLRGPAADQAEASGWEAAWDALRRPSARTAVNPGGMVWVAVRRAVATERQLVRGPSTASTPVTTTGPSARSSAAHVPAAPRGYQCGAAWVSLDDLMESGWEPSCSQVQDHDALGPAVRAVVASLVEAGWERRDAEDAIAIMADTAAPARTGSPATRWRWASLRLGIPEWQVRRLAALLLGGSDWSGVLQLSVTHGPGVVDDPAVREAVGSTTKRSVAGPRAWLTPWSVGTSAMRIA